MRTILTTTGTSLLTNTARSLKKQLIEVTVDEIRRYLNRTSAEEATAETNSLLKIAEPTDEVVLLYTSTTDGKLCAEQIKHYLEKKGWSNLRLHQLALEYNEANFERYGLRELVDVLINEIERSQRKNQEVVINATGGFKAEIAYTTLVGMIFQVPVKYIYQNFARPITFPCLPITWNLDLLIEYEDFFAWIDEDCRQSYEVKERLQSIPDSDRLQSLLLPPDDEGYIFLSPAGNILWRRVIQQRQVAEWIEEPPPSEVPIADKISPSLKREKHHIPDRTLDFAKRLAEIPCVEQIIGGFFENTTMKRIKGISEDGSIRLLWADNEKATNLSIRTTAKGYAQTLQVCDRHISPLLYSF
ncbi:putative CRISPR-associated protein [Pleurocapsales cyanobacterium LEGE 06147]|nr:putative CRISPR-associated protein [Pleurocapsales cyanobacterium LEGE 06147]